MLSQAGLINKVRHVMINTMDATPDAQNLAVSWDDGTSSTLPAYFLRVEAMDAFTRRERIDTGSVKVSKGIEITGVFPVGGYGVNIHFSDGHDKAIYPFSLLRDLSDRFDK